ncbi:MAG: hypothetical protein R3A51_00875 [Nannocystaceae bacterium]|nr:hypothetical protein [Myxococcales bacterium]
MGTPSFLRRVVAAAALLCLTPACSGGWVGHGDTYYARPGKKAVPGEATFRFGLPGGSWEPIKEKGVQVAWASRDFPAVINVSGQCERHGDSSLEQFTDHLRIDFREWKILSQTTEPLAGRDAVRTVVEGELDGVTATTLEFVVLKKDGCLFDFQLIAAPGHHASAKPDFDRVVAAFKYPL